MKYITPLVLLLAGSLAAFAADKKPNSLAGTYVGVVEDEKATLILKADGSALARPGENAQGFALRGKWMRKGNRVTAKLADPDGKEGQIVLRVDGLDLVFEKIINPDGREKLLSPPLFVRQKDGPKGKAPVGAYVGVSDGDEMRVELNANGRLTAKPTDPDAPANAVMLGEWKRGKAAGTLDLAVDADDGLAKVRVKIAGGGLQLLRLEKPNGEVEEYTETRLKRVKADPKKDAAVPPKGAAKQFVGKWNGIVKEDEIQLQLKADGSVVAIEDEEPINGTWKLAGGGLVVRVMVEGKAATAHFLVDGADLVLTKMEKLDGGEETYEPPRLRRKEALGDKKFAGIYAGEVEDSEVKLTIEADGKIVAEKVECGELETITGKWMAKGNRVMLNIADGVKVEFRADGKDLLLIRLESPDGEVEEYEPRFQKQRKQKKD